MLDIVDLLFAVYYDYWYLILIVYINQKVMFAVYLYKTDYCHWWAWLIPFGHLYCKRELCALNIPLIIIYVLISSCAYYTLDPIFITVFCIVSAICNHKFCSMYMDSGNPWIFSLVPGAKYIMLIKEVYVIASDGTG